MKLPTYFTAGASIELKYESTRGFVWYLPSTSFIERTMTHTSTDEGKKRWLKVLLILLILLMLVLGWWRCYCVLVDSKFYYSRYASQLNLPPIELLLLLDMVVLLGLLCLPLLMVLRGGGGISTGARVLFILLVVSLVLSLDTLHDTIAQTSQKWSISLLLPSLGQSGAEGGKFLIVTLIVMMAAMLAFLFILASRMGLPSWTLAPYALLLLLVGASIIHTPLSGQVPRYQK